MARISTLIVALAAAAPVWADEGPVDIAPAIVPDAPGRPGAPAVTEDADTLAAAETAPPTDLVAPLSVADADAYARIFELQLKGRWSAADREIANLDDRILMGHVLEQRLMHPTAYRARYSELKAWMRDYADHPGARRVHKLARLRRPADGGWLKRPEPAPAKSASSPAPIHPDFAARSWKARKSEPYVRRLLRRGRISAARSYLDRTDVVSGLTEAERDRLLARIAYARFLRGDAESALHDVGPVTERRGDALPLALKTQGLAAWRLADLETAEAAFTSLIEHPFASERDRAFGAFWAARARMRLGLFKAATEAFEAAATHGFEFYGLLAGAVLGRTPTHSEASAEDADIMATVVTTFPAAKRAAALIQAGRRGDADAELRLLFRRAKPEWDDELLLFASALQLPATQIEIAEASADGAAEALYPLPAYEPGDGFEVDRALLFAIMRQESRFKTEAVSRAGARGLMQIMPRTASFIGRDRTLRYRSRRRELLEPDLNLTLAQDYVTHLMGDWTSGDLIRTLIAYNAGPGNLRRWDRRHDVLTDPLLYVESVPNTESRHYVQAVLRNMWIYRGRLSQTPASLSALARGVWPHYEPQDAPTTRAARFESGTGPT